MKVKTILVSQPEPKIENSPYALLEQKHNVQIDFVPFIHVEGVPTKDVRKQKIDISQFKSIILTSKNAVDHYFRVAEEMRYKVPETTKYFCQTEAIALYLQKYVVYRKRKIYFGKRDFADLTTALKKFKDDHFLLPASDKLNKDVPETLDGLGVKWTQGVFFRTAMSDLSHLKDVKYDVLCFYSPTGIDSLFHNFPDFKQNKTRIAVFGNTTKTSAEEHNLRVDINAPTPEAPSMTTALDLYLKKVNK